MNGKKENFEDLQNIPMDILTTYVNVHLSQLITLPSTLNRYSLTNLVKLTNSILYATLGPEGPGAPSGPVSPLIP